EPQPALVRAERRAELHAEAAVELHAPGVVGPRHPEDDLPLRLAQASDHLGVGVLGVLGHDRAKALQYLAHGLVELGLARVAGDDLVEDRDEAIVQEGHAMSPFRWCSDARLVRAAPP